MRNYEVNGYVDDMNINNMDSFVAKQLDYQENYLLADLKKIADFYDIPVRKMRKEEIIQEIVVFEIDPGNATDLFTSSSSLALVNRNEE